MTLPEPGPQAVDWARIDRLLCEEYRMTPRDVDALTYPEIAVLLMSRDERGPPGGRGMSDQEMAAEIARWRSLTPSGRLDDARRKRDGL